MTWHDLCPGTEKKEEVNEALASQDRELEAKAGEETKHEEQELGGEPLQQMPGVEIKANPISDDDDDADLSKVEVQHDDSAAAAAVEEEPLQTDVKDEKMDEVVKPSKKEAAHGLPHETVPQPNLDAVK